MVLLLFGKVHCSLLYLSTGSDMCRDSPDLQELRGRIIQVFFKHLTSSNEVAVDMSQEGLAAVIAYQKMPKTLLAGTQHAPESALCRSFSLCPFHSFILLQ